MNKKKQSNREGPTKKLNEETIETLVDSPLHLKSNSDDGREVIRKPPPTASHSPRSSKTMKKGSKNDSQYPADVSSLTISSLHSSNTLEDMGSSKHCESKDTTNRGTTSSCQESKDKKVDHSGVQSPSDDGSSEEANTKYQEKKPTVVVDQKLKGSGGGSDTGYAGSASSNDDYEHDGNNSYTSNSSDGKIPTNESDEDEHRSAKNKRSQNNGSPSSSDIADFSSSDSDFKDSSSDEDVEEAVNSPTNSSGENNETKVATASASLTSMSQSKVSKGVTSFHSTSRSSGNSKRSRGINSTSSDSTKARRIGGFVSSRGEIPNSWDFIERSIRKKASIFHTQNTQQLIDNHAKALQENYQLAIDGFNGNLSDISTTKMLPQSSNKQDENNVSLKSEYVPFYEIGVDAMAKILSYLSPSEIISVLSEPFSRRFRESFTVPQDVWKILCLSAPFYAHSDEEDATKSSGKSECDFSTSITTIEDDLQVLCSKYKYRLMYASFARCLTYLDRIKHDLERGKAAKQGNPMEIDELQKPYAGNSSLRRFFEEVRGVQSPQQPENDRNLNERKMDDGEGNVEREAKKPSANETRIKYGASEITNKLLGPNHQAGIAGDVNLPLSCAVYSIVNWMVAFADVAGIQVMCMNVLPMLLEDDHQRTTAQNAGMTDIVLRAMVIFPNNVELHTSAFHTLVLLARPIGSKEGMIFYRAMVKASGIFNVGSNTGKSGIAIMMESMKRFATNERLQAMSCWSMVNVALIQSQKVALVRLGGISAAGNAMMLHPMSEDVQFRALFALINLVIPSENLPEDSLDNSSSTSQSHERSSSQSNNQKNEIDMLDESVEFITHLVVVAMKNFCSNVAILNRACLVLHNLSLKSKYHDTIISTSHCYQMLEWCVENYKQDKVLQQSARGTLQRLQVTLSNDESLRMRFLEMIRSQQQ